MARHFDTPPTLTPNNRIYLYQLLSSELGCGKQTFLPAVEEALASDRMTAEDLGFDSTRALLEALVEFVKLTVFKGGRIYATVIAQPEWDAALEAAAAGKPNADGKSDKPWKRKKTDKSLKPVRPKRVKKPEPEPVSESESDAEPAVEQPKQASEVNPEAATPEIPDAAVEPVEEQAPAAELEVGKVEDIAPDQVGGTQEEGTPHPEEMDTAAASEKGPEPVLEPAISLTVTFDPYSGIVEETKMESHPVAPKPAPAPQTEPAQVAGPQPEPAQVDAPQPKPAQVAEPEPVHESLTASRAPVATSPASESVATAPVPSPISAVAEPDPTLLAVSSEVLATYPVDFATEVYLDSERVAELCELLPYGTDVFTLLAEDYTRARELELISGTRARATFPLRIQHIDSTEPLTITLKKRSGSGLKWELSQVE